MTENENFVILNHDVFEFLYNIYKGTDIQRYSIQVQKDEENLDKQEFVIEVFPKKI